MTGSRCRCSTGFFCMRALSVLLRGFGVYIVLSVMALLKIKVNISDINDRKSSLLRV